jgi:c-di-GMP-binding flagellar brake protein YcgR
MPTITPVDLRRWERASVAIPAILVLKTDKLASEISTTIMNISLCGAAIRTELALAPEQGMEITITGHFSRAIPARVVWVRQDESGYGTIAGLKFLAYAIAMAG